MWVKKSGDSDFDVTMGSFDGAELCELVGLFILYTISKEYGLSTNGLYRDDGLCCFNGISGPQSEIIKKNLIILFKEKFKLNITINSNLKIVNFRSTCLTILISHIGKQVTSHYISMLIRTILQTFLKLFPQ